MQFWALPDRRLCPFDRLPEDGGMRRSAPLAVLPHGAKEGPGVGAIGVVIDFLICAVVAAVLWWAAKPLVRWAERRRLRRMIHSHETRDDPLFGRLKWFRSLKRGSGSWDGEFRTSEGQSVGLFVSSGAIDREDARSLFSRITADLEAVRQRLADEHLPDLNKSLWANSPMTRDAFLAGFQLSWVAIDDDGAVVVWFDDVTGEDLLMDHAIGLIFHLDGTVEATGSG
jgi:hypothetical protein